MSGPRAKAVRAFLKESGGATVQQIADAMGVAHSTLAGKHGVLAQMPDVYIDRWESKRNSRGHMRYTAVWCVVDIQHCPKPEPESAKRKAEQRQKRGRVPRVSLDPSVFISAA